MIYAFLIIIFLALLYKLIRKQTIIRKKPKQKEKSTNATKQLIINGAYQKRWLFSLNEKDAYRKLKTICDEKGLTLFAKIRLLDLVEPVPGIQKYKTYLYKIQAKHVDFVICNSQLIVKYIIELDDSSHDTKKRKERDKLVDEIVKSVGYKIFHVRAISDEIKELLN